MKRNKNGRSVSSLDRKEDVEKGKGRCWEGGLGNETDLGILLQVCCTAAFFFLGRSFLKENIRYEDCTPAHRVRIRIFQEHRVKYFTKGIVLILVCLLLSEK